MATELSISKSKYLAGLQCQKLLWFYYNAKGEIPKPAAALQAIFDQGHEVGALAKKMFPDGMEVGAGITNLPETIRLTADAVKLRKPLFEAAFNADGGYARVDILIPVKSDAWDILEIKSGTSLENVHVSDLAFQRWVLAQAGLKIHRCILGHVNSEFVRCGEIDPQKFFMLEDITAQVAELTPHIAAQLGAMLQTIRQPKAPPIEIGPQCDHPYGCPLQDRCWSFLPEASVFTLYRGGKKSFALFQRGIHHLKDIPADVALTDNQSIQRATLLAGQPHVDRPAIAAFLAQLEYPVSYLDFETYATAIPLFDGVSPYQQVPFQFSLHVVRSNDAKSRPDHFSFLVDGPADPRPEFMRRLRDALPETGSVVTYNASFEKNCLKQCAELLPEHSAWAKKVERRVVDLLLPFRGFRYYHPQQNGSASIKAVLPVLTGKSYAEMEIQEGGTASREFLRVTFSKISNAERVKVRRQLEDYCGLDTMGMVEIMDQLKLLVVAKRALNKGEP